MKSRKLVSILLLLIMLASVMIAVPTTASAAKSGDWEYTVEDDFGVTINKYNGTDSVVNVPSKLGGYFVRTIDGGYFPGEYGGGAFFQNSKITKVILPNTITKIGSRAFKECTNLKSITIPSDVFEIGEGAFKDCVNLNTVKFKTKTITEFSEELFYGCASLTSITIPTSVERICSKCFKKTALASINIPKNVEHIYVTKGWTGDYHWAFGDCENLSAINVDSKNKYYSSFDGALYNKEKTEIICVPHNKTCLNVFNGVNELSKFVFGNIVNLKKVIIPPSVKSISGIGYYNYDAWRDYKIEGFTIYGAKGSEAERYAINNDFTFIEMQPESVNLNKSEIELGAKESFSLKATSSPSWVQTNIKWTSSDTSVVTVSSKGKISAVKAGTATITSTTSNGKTAACTVTVKKAPTKISLNPKSKTMKKGKTLSLSVKFKSGQISNSIKWSTSNSKVAKVNSKGVVTAKKKGTCKITAKTYNGKKATCKIKVK